MNKLNPKISNREWTTKDGEKLFELHRKHGSAWKNISGHFKGRTDNFLKNQFFSLIRRSLRRIIRFLEIPKGTSLKELKFFFNIYKKRNYYCQFYQTKNAFTLSSQRKCAERSRYF